MIRQHVYTCGRCSVHYDPATQGCCPGCMHHPHLEDECDHDCDSCSSVLFPPINGHLDVFEPVGAAESRRWRRAARSP